VGEDERGGALRVSKSLVDLKPLLGVLETSPRYAAKKSTAREERRFRSGVEKKKKGKTQTITNVKGKNMLGTCQSRGLSKG